MDLNRKQEVFIKVLRNIIKNYKIKAEFSTNDNDIEVIVAQEQTGAKIVFFDAKPLYNYFMIDIFSTSILKAKSTAVELGSLIGQTIYFEEEIVENEKTYIEKWQVIFKQQTNPQPIEYYEIRRVSYNMTFQTITNMYSRKEKTI